MIALARSAEPVNRIRRMIREHLRLPSETRNEADLVHTTQFRYCGRLSDPEKFLAMLEEDMSAEATAEVTSWSYRRSWCIRRWKRKCSAPSARFPVSAPTRCAGGARVESICATASKGS